MILVVQSTYELVQVGLFDGSRLIYTHALDKKEASALLIPTIDTLTSAAKIQIQDCECAIINQGPGPFTTLRIVIATMNGISFATGLPLVGVNALDALLYTSDPTYSRSIVAMLNAYGGDVYFAVRAAGEHQSRQGVGPVMTVPLETLTQEVTILGNATVQQQALLIDRLSRDTVIPGVIHADLATLAQYGQLSWKRTRTGVHHLSPLYFKNHPAQSQV
jgi:tRNA threonylcarbamoyladenosine biosynthesis protein TsaB